MSGYELNEKDIDSTISYLKTIDPENATPEMAIAFLEELHARVHLLAHENPALLEKVYKELKEKKIKARTEEYPSL
jgi:cytochrome oxidase Cu insertion factor (SCO1/SenC/PrrC family)